MANAIQPIRSAEEFSDIWDRQEAPTSSGPDISRLRVVLRYAGGLLLILFLLSLVVPIGGAVIGSGEVGVESRVKRIAHPDGGVIERIFVRNGQHVTKGQLLIRLEDIVSGAAADFSSMTVEQMLAHRARLEAERVGSGRLQFPANLTEAGTPTAARAMADERQLFRIKLAEEAQIRAQLLARIEQYEQQIAAYEAQISSLKEQRRLIEPELAGVQELWEKQLITINRKNELERTAVNLDGSVAALNSNIAQSRAQITEAREQLIQLGQTRRASAAEELGQLNTALNDQQVRNVSANDVKSNSEIRAPYSGVVEKVQFAAVGDVIRAAEPIMEIVPDEDLMIIEVSISPADIDQVKRGQKAQVRFPGFSRAATPEVTGTLTYVATDRQVDEASKTSFYMARISLDQAAVKKEGLDLRSGMPAEVFIATGDRSMISVLTKPLRDQFARAFREE